MKASEFGGGSLATTLLDRSSKHNCDLLWRNREQVARQMMFLILPVQYMTNIYHIRSTKQSISNKHIITNKAHTYCCSYCSCVIPFVIVHPR